MEEKAELKEKRGIVIGWFLKHSCEEFPIYDRDVDELLKNLKKKTTPRPLKEKANKENKITVTHLPYSKSIRITYETEEEAEQVLNILAKNGINGNSRKYTG